MSIKTNYTVKRDSALYYNRQGKIINVAEIHSNQADLSN